MVQSINTQSDLVVKATSFLGFCSYGKIMIGDNGFEFFNDRNIRDYIQIPWGEIDYVIVSVRFSGRWIPRFSIQTKKSGSLSFSSKNTHKLLREIRCHVDSDHMIRSLSFFEIIKRSILRIFDR